MRLSYWETKLKPDKWNPIDITFREIYLCFYLSYELQQAMKIEHEMQNPSKS